MVTKHTSCSGQQLRRYLSQQLSRAEETAIEQHLDTCQDCQATIEQLAAEGEFWASACKSLSTVSAVGTPLDNGPNAATQSFDVSLTNFIQSFLTPSEDPAMLGRIANYEVSGVIGHGAMGVVVKAFEASLNRFVAIKVMSPALSTNGPARKRFAREAQAAAAIVHNNVTAIHAISEWNGLPYLVMPYVGGESLQKRIDRDGPLKVSEILRVGHQVASGLAAAHSQGLIHRDIKPSNILLESGVERLQITDFGLARAADDATLTQSGVIAGTPQYMSPEQSRGEAIDHRSDLFSLGSLLYAVCTGHPPFRAETPFGVLRRISDEQPRSIRESNPEIPKWLCDLIGRLQRKKPDDRLESASEAANLFEQCLAHVQQPDIIDLPVSLTPTSLRFASMAALIFIVLSIAGGVFLFWKPQPTSSTQVAVTSVDEAANTGTTASAGSQIRTPEVSSEPATKVVAPKSDDKPQVAMNADTTEKESPAKIPVVEAPAATPTTLLRYSFAEDAEVAYSVTMTADTQNAERSVSGIIVYSAKAADDDRLTITCRSDLSHSERLRNPLAMHPFSSFHEWATSTGQKQTTIQINHRGEVLQRHQNDHLPFALGNLPQLLLPELPPQTTATWQRQKHIRLNAEPVASSYNRSSFMPPIPSFHGASALRRLSAMADIDCELVESSAEGIRIAETISTVRGQPLNVKGTGTLIFDPETGQISRYSARQTVTESDGSLQKRFTVELQCIRMSSEEQKSWEQQRATERADQKRERERSFTTDEIALIVEELAVEKNVSSWLMKIDKKPIANVSDAIVDAVIPFLNSASTNHKRMAKQIIDRVPDERLNPFKELDEEISPSQEQNQQEASVDSSEPPDSKDNR